MGQSLSVIGTDRNDRRAEAGRANVSHPYLALEQAVYIQFNREMERLTVLHKQTAFDSDSAFTDIHHTTGR